MYCLSDTQSSRLQTSLANYIVFPVTQKVHNMTKTFDYLINTIPLNIVLTFWPLVERTAMRRKDTAIASNGSSDYHPEITQRALAEFNVFFGGVGERPTGKPCAY